MSLSFTYHNTDMLFLYIPRLFLCPQCVGKGRGGTPSHEGICLGQASGEKACTHETEKGEYIQDPPLSFSAAGKAGRGTLPARIHLTSAHTPHTLCLFLSSFYLSWEGRPHLTYLKTSALPTMTFITFCTFLQIIIVLYMCFVCN